METPENSCIWQEGLPLLFLLSTLTASSIDIYPGPPGVHVACPVFLFVSVTTRTVFPETCDHFLS